MKKTFFLLFIGFCLAIPTLSTIKEIKSFTFKVDDVEISKDIPSYLITAQEKMDAIGVTGQSEDSSHRENKDQVFTYGNFPGFVEALHMSYQNHYPLKLSASDFIILVGQGLSKHINNNAEKLRYEFVSHAGQETIRIERDNFIKGQQNDWSTVFGDFAEEIKKRVKNDIYDVVVDDTSVATPTSKIVSEITLMDSMQNYFKYVVMTRCGIPKITLEGTKEDWELLRNKVGKLVEMNKDNKLKLDWWLTPLVPLVDKICDTGANGNADAEFWSGIYKYQSMGSGNAFVSGWITTFLPYIKKGVNDFSDAKLDTSQIPTQYSEVPFIWDYYGQEIAMSFYGGFLGAQFNEEDFSVQPAYFWSVNYKDDQKTN